MAAVMKEVVGMGGVGVVNLPITHSVKVYTLRGKFKFLLSRFLWRLALVSFCSPESICEEIWNWTAMKVGLRKKTRSG